MRKEKSAGESRLYALLMDVLGEEADKTLVDAVVRLSPRATLENAGRVKALKKPFLKYAMDVYGRDVVLHCALRYQYQRSGDLLDEVKEVLGASDARAAQHLMRLPIGVESADE